MNFRVIMGLSTHMAKDANNVDDFVRQYDGAANPVGIAMTNSDWVDVLHEIGFSVITMENHFFPVRFLKFANKIPIGLHRILDAWFGTMVYFNLRM